jgi:cobalamin synthase
MLGGVMDVFANALSDVKENKKLEAMRDAQIGVL